MTRITLRKARGEYTLTAQGHAGYAGNGSDIVCAALSLMLQALCCAADQAGALLEYEEQAGYLHARAALNDITRAQLDLCLKGLELLQKAYPEHVEVNLLLKIDAKNAMIKV